jgi:RND family efflux transporter MFP subunit
MAALLLLAGCERLGEVAHALLPGQGSSGGDARAGGSARAAELTEPGPAAPLAAVAVVTHPVTLDARQTSVEAVGTARASASAEVFPAASGEVAKILFEPGAFVRQGTPLVELDARRERLAVSLAEVSVREAEQLLTRYRRIEDTGAVSESQIDEVEARLQAERITLEQARVALTDRVIRAPFDGHLGLRLVDPGARIGTDTAVVRIDDRRTLYVDFPAPEQVFAGVGIGMALEVLPFSGPHAVRAARVEAIDSRIDPASRTFTVRAVIDNTDDGLRPGMSFRVRFRLTGEPLPVVPESALVWGDEGAALWVVRSGRAARVPVRIGERRAGSVLVEAALAPGERVISEGVQKVREGTPVTEMAAGGEPFPPTAEFRPEGRLP